MTFELSTHDIQKLVIGMIFSTTGENRSHVITDDDYHRITDRLQKINGMCCEENGYTVRVTIE